jgi:hypothetical protein
VIPIPPRARIVGRLGGTVVLAQVGDEATITGVGLDGGERWSQSVPMRSGRCLYSGLPILVGDDVVLCDGSSLWDLSADGVFGERRFLPMAKGEFAEAFARAPGGWVVVFRKGRRSRLVRVGDVSWEVVLDDCARAVTLRVCDDRVFVRHVDMPSTGFAAWHGLDLHTGALRWTSGEHPQGEHRILPDGTFLFGASGYGAARLTAIGPDWRSRGSWPVHGKVAATTLGVVVVHETHRTGTPGQLCRLGADAAVARGAQLTGSYTSTLFPWGDGVVFWRGGTVWRSRADLSVEPVVQAGWANGYGVGGVLVGEDLVLGLGRNHDDHGALAFERGFVHVAFRG